jgi:phosphotransferase system enzyme I (PtsI)
VSPGVAFGHVYLVDRRKLAAPKRHIAAALVEDEVARLDRGLEEARLSLELLKERAPDHAAILEAHILMMEDPLLVEGARGRIRGARQCAEWALRATVHEIRARFDALDDPYFRERKSDLDAVGERVLAALLHQHARPVDAVPDDAIVIAHDLSPADTIALSHKKLRAFVLEVGGATSHTAILARALGIPAVVGCAAILEHAGTDDEIIVDGGVGEVVLRPSTRVTERYRGIARELALVDAEMLAEARLPAETPDGHRVPLLANVEFHDEIESALRHGAEGVGLYRTEFLFLRARTIPDDDAHALACTDALSLLPEMPAVFRTLDLGSDKLASFLDVPREQNPALGLRACRLGLVRPAILRPQLRGLLRATSCGTGAILLPLIGSVDELLQVREMITSEMDRLEDDGLPVWREVPVGVMIELPSAVWIADDLARHCDFFSVGTNDLIQYSLALDRSNEHVAHLYQPLHPGVLRALRHVVAAAKSHSRPVSLCGEMAADPLLLPVCLGLGFDTLSMPGVAIPRVKWALRRFPHEVAVQLVEACCALATAKDIEALVQLALVEHVPELLDAVAQSWDAT